MRSKKTEFSDEELLRYSRHILLPQVDISGQLAIANASVLIVGVGGLGSPVAQYLAASGVGRLVLADFDHVDESNLQRQVIHDRSRVGMNKAQSAALAIEQLNQFVEVTTLEEALSGENLAQVLGQVDVVVDCSDNFETRRAVNRACVQQKKPLVSGAAIRVEGQLCVFDARQPDSPCYQCLFPETPNEATTCAQNGILSPVVGVIGSLQALETLKLIVGNGTSSVGYLHLYDALKSQWRKLQVPKDAHCLCCS